MTAALPGNDVHSLYEKGYGALTQNDYAGAEAAFRSGFEVYPSGALTWGMSRAVLIRLKDPAWPRWGAGLSP